MKALVLLCGILTSCTGAFALANYTSTFDDIAFVVGVVMIISGAFNSIAYIISGKGSRKLTETMLVEGIVTLLYGLAVLSNQVTDSMLNMFFGTWLTLSGVTRFSQSIYVSRFNTKDWSKIIPLSAIATVLGVIMMLPGILSGVMSLVLVGGAFLIDGLSTIIYSMYMKNSNEEMAVGEARARARAKAKKEEHVAKQKERKRLEKLSKEERIKEEKKRLAKEKAEEEERAREKAAARAKLRSAIKPEEERTLKFTEDQIDEINKIDYGYRARKEKEKLGIVEEDIKEEPQIEKISFVTDNITKKKKKLEKNKIESKKLSDKKSKKNKTSEASKKKKPVEKEIKKNEEKKEELQESLSDSTPINFD